MKVSILVPIYKVEAYIERCVISLFEQTYNDIEYIFIDDASPDSSIKLLDNTLNNYPKRKNNVKIISNHINRGIGYNRNVLLSNATGEYIQFVDSDDWIDKDMISFLVDIAKESDSDIICSDYYLNFDNEEKVFKVNYPKKVDSLLGKTISSDICSELWKLFIKRSLIEKNNIRFTDNINTGEDYPFSVKLYYFANNITLNKTPFYHYWKNNQFSYSLPKRQNLIDYTNAITAVEAFLCEKRILSDYNKDLLLKKFNLRNHYLYDRKFRNLKAWKKTYPETESMYMNLGFREKLIYYWAKICSSIF